MYNQKEVVSLWHRNNLKDIKMKKVTIIFATLRNVILTEGLIQMLDQQINNNTFVFELEEEEIEMLIEEVEDEIEFLLESVSVEELN